MFSYCSQVYSPEFLYLEYNIYIWRLAVKKFDIPEIPRELMLRATRKAFDIYDGTDLEQNDPAITLH